PRIMTAAEIAAALGNARPDGKDWRCDCPLCRRPNLTLDDGKTRLLVKCFSGCITKDVIAELRRRGLYGKTNGSGAAGCGPETRAEHEAQAQSAKARRKSKIDSAMDIWRQSHPARDTMVATYLASRLL